VLCTDLRNTATLPYAILTDSFFITELESIYCAVQTESLYRIKEICFVFKGLIKHSLYIGCTEKCNRTLLIINLDKIINSVLFVQNGKTHIALNPEWGCQTF
jgi:hypothetical protein